MANRYDQPQASQFINTYSPIPFQEMQGVINEYRQAYEQTQERQDKFSEWLAQKSQFLIRGSKDEAAFNAEKAKIEGFVTGLSDDDLKDRIMQGKMRSFIRQEIQNPLFNAMESQYPLYMDQVKRKRDLEEKGLWNNVRERQWQESIRNHSSLDGAFSANVKPYINNIDDIIEENFKGIGENMIPLGNTADGWTVFGTDPSIVAKTKELTYQEAMQQGRAQDLIDNENDKREQAGKKPMTESQSKKFIMDLIEAGKNRWLRKDYRQTPKLDGGGKEKDPILEITVNPETTEPVGGTVKDAMAKAYKVVQGKDPDKSIQYKVIAGFETVIEETDKAAAADPKLQSALDTATSLFAPLFDEEGALEGMVRKAHFASKEKKPGYKGDDSTITNVVDLFRTYMTMMAYGYSKGANMGIDRPSHS
jgi:hypothetical protein